MYEYFFLINLKEILFILNEDKISRTKGLKVATNTEKLVDQF